MSITYCASELEQKRVKGSDFWVVLVFFFGSFPNNDNLTVVVSLCERRFDGWYGAICGEHEFWVGQPQLKGQHRSGRYLNVFVLFTLDGILKGVELAQNCNPLISSNAQLRNATIFDNR